MAILREVLGTCELKSALSMLPRGGGLVLHHGPNRGLFGMRVYAMHEICTFISSSEIC